MFSSRVRRLISTFWGRTKATHIDRVRKCGYNEKAKIVSSRGDILTSASLSTGPSNRCSRCCEWSVCLNIPWGSLEKPRKLSVCCDLTTIKLQTVNKLISERYKPIPGVTFVPSVHTEVLWFVIIFDMPRCPKEILKPLGCFSNSLLWHW